MIDISKLSTAELIELRNECNQLLKKNDIAFIQKVSSPHEKYHRLFDEEYYIEKVNNNDYSELQLITIRSNARRNEWNNLLVLIDGEPEKDDSEEAVDAGGFWDMMEKKANEC